MRLFFVRHAQSENNARPLEERVSDPALTEIGRQQADSIARHVEELQPTHLLVSPFRRALETAEPIRKALGLPSRVWVELHEHGGCFDGYNAETLRTRPGMNGRQIREAFPGTATPPEIEERGWWRGDDYETHESADARARTIRQRLLDEHRAGHDRVVLVTHGTFMRFQMRALLGLTLDDDDPFGPVHNTAVCEVFLTADEVILMSWNSAGHLPADLRTDIGPRLERL